MNAPARTNGTFCPPFVPPAARPVPFPVNVVRLISNNLSVIPRQAYEETVVVAPGPPRMAFITGEGAVKRLLHKQHEEFPKGRLQKQILDPLFGDAMVSSEGARWRWQRSATAPLFRHAELLRYGPVMGRAARSMIETWRRGANGSARDIDRDMGHVTFDVISKTMLVGGAPRVLSEIEKHHADYFRYVNWWVINRMFRLPAWAPRPGRSVMKTHETRLRNLVTDLVAQRQSEGADGDDLIGKLLVSRDPETGRQMQRELIVQNIIAFLIAGFDTTSLGLMWSLYLIANSPEYQELIRQEARDVAADEPIGSDHYDRLTVTRQVIDETLRLYPTAPVIVRDIPFDIELDGVHVPAGTIGVIPIYAIHRHRRIWRDPDLFDPSRFAANADFKPSRFQYLPFGAGPRICIGATFSLIEMTIMIATFVRAARFELCDGFRPEPVGQMFLTSRNGMKLSVTTHG